MQLLDDHMFRLWRDGIVSKEEVMIKANMPDDLANRISRSERGTGRRRRAGARRMAREAG